MIDFPGSWFQIAIERLSESSIPVKDYDAESRAVNFRM